METAYHKTVMERGPVAMKIVDLAVGASEQKINSYDISLDADLHGDFGMNSMDMLTLVMDVEKEYVIAIPDRVAAGLRTVKKYADYIEENVPGVGALTDL
jgi:acyl carrier protein